MLISMIKIQINQIIEKKIILQLNINKEECAQINIKRYFRY